MNVIISNKNSELLDSLNLEKISKINGEYNADELINMFSNFFYNRIIIDITSIKDYKNISNVRKLALNLDPSKIVVVLDESKEVNKPEYISMLISMGLYNFSKNLAAIKFLIDEPNTYKDVIHLHNQKFKFEDVIVKGVKILSSKSEVIETNENNENNESFEVIDEISEENKQEDTEFKIVEEVVDEPIEGDIMTEVTNSKKQFVLGVKNITENAGATTLVYLLKKELSKKYSVCALEIDKKDFKYFFDLNMNSCSKEDINITLALNSSYDIILLDLNNSNKEDVCDEVLYLLEPSIIKLNKLIAHDKNIFRTLEEKKIVLNKTLLDKVSVSNFEKESGCKIFYTLPPINCRISHHKEVEELISMIKLD